MQILEYSIPRSFFGEDAKTGWTLERNCDPCTGTCSGLDAFNIEDGGGCLQVSVLMVVLACFLVAPEEAAHWE